MTDKQISDRESAILYLSTLGESITEGNIEKEILNIHIKTLFMKTNEKNFQGNNQIL